MAAVADDALNRSTQERISLVRVGTRQPGGHSRSTAAARRLLQPGSGRCWRRNDWNLDGFVLDPDTVALRSGNPRGRDRRESLRSIAENDAGNANHR